MPALDDDREEAPFYVYVYGIAGRLAYVGKGKGLRAWSHLKKSHNPHLTKSIKEARKSGQSVRVRIIAKGLTEADALRLEKRAIFKWHEKLCNRSWGGRSELEKAHDDAIGILSQLCSEEWVRRRGVYQGLPVERSLEIHGMIREFCLQHILDFEMEQRRVRA